MKKWLKKIFGLNVDYVSINKLKLEENFCKSFGLK